MGKWIWLGSGQKEDQYVEFVSTFNSDSKNLQMKICADTDYMVYLNNKLVGFGQYYFYPNNPVYDVLKLKAKVGENKLKIIVYHCGGNSFSTYAKGDAGLYFEIKDDNKVILESNESILSAESKYYESEHKVIITPQMGYGMFVDGKRVKTKLNYQPSVEVNKSYNFRERENLKLKLLPRAHIDVKYIEKGHYLIDLGKETVGYLDFDFVSNKNQLVKIAWGEHIVDGKVREIIQNRTFVTNFKARKGSNKFFSTLRRYGLRYIEVYAEEDININYFGITPVTYPFKEKKWSIDNELRRKIYETAVYTLKCCYHEHFEDCPWREQSFYCMDSRNQMLYHSLVFKNKETFKSALKLMMEDNRKDGLLSITFPNDIPLTIPSYSFYAFEEFVLYYNMSHDIETLKVVYPKLQSLLEALNSHYNEKEELMYNFHGYPYWNFYEWIKGLDDDPWYQGDVKDCLYNLLMIVAYENMAKINKILGKPGDYKKNIAALKRGINRQYYNKEKGLYYFSDKWPYFYRLVNSFAILTGTANKEKSLIIAEKLVNDDEMISSSLSMRCFQYDALLKVNKEKYKEYILNDLDVAFKEELDKGATTFWETELGEADFDGAGSLCHAWSSIAIYYYNKLGVVKKL